MSASPLTLPLARLRAVGCKVSTVLGHDPITTGSHPKGTSRWQYAITLPEDVKVPDIDKALWSYDHAWSATFGEAVAYNFRDGRIMVSAFARPDPKATKPAQIRASRREVERELGVLLGRIAAVLEA